MSAAIEPVEEPRVVLEARGLCVAYGRGPSAVRAVDEADIVLRRGEVLGLAGESGSGKSTLAYAMTRLLRPPGVITGGEVTFHDHRHEATAVDLLGTDPARLRRLRWAEIAIVFQSALHALNPVLSVQAQLTDVLAAHGQGGDRQGRRERAARLLELVGINRDRLRSYPHELSGGMRQRVMIAMALALDPQVVIFDEPTTALDVVTQREILDQVIALRNELGFAVLFITHDLSLLVELADVIAIMYGGRVVEQGPAREVFRAPRHPYTLGLLGSFPSLHGPRRTLTGIAGTPPDLAALPAGCAFVPRCRWRLPECEQIVPRLRPVATGGGERAAACHLHHSGNGLVIPSELNRRATVLPEPASGEPA